jgi:hypothetical protein
MGTCPGKMLEKRGRLLSDSVKQRRDRTLSELCVGHLKTFFGRSKCYLKAIGRGASSGVRRGSVGT